MLIWIPGPHRVHAHHPCWAFAPLHELSPQILHSCICDIMSIGRCGWSGRTSPRTDIEIRCSVGHGHRSVRHPLPSFLQLLLLDLIMRISRCTTSCLLCYLSSAYPGFAMVFQFLIALDFASHYMHMYRCVLNPVLACPVLTKYHSVHS